MRLALQGAAVPYTYASHNLEGLRETPLFCKTLQGLRETPILCNTFR